MVTTRSEETRNVLRVSELVVRVKDSAVDFDQSSSCKDPSIKKPLEPLGHSLEECRDDPKQSNDVSLHNPFERRVTEFVDGKGKTQTREDNTASEASRPNALKSSPISSRSVLDEPLQTVKSIENDHPTKAEICSFLSTGKKHQHDIDSVASEEQQNAGHGLAKLPSILNDVLMHHHESSPALSMMQYPSHRTTTRKKFSLNDRTRRAKQKFDSAKKHRLAPSDRLPPKSTLSLSHFRHTSIRRCNQKSATGRGNSGRCTSNQPRFGTAVEFTVLS